MKKTWMTITRLLLAALIAIAFLPFYPSAQAAPAPHASQSPYIEMHKTTEQAINDLYSSYGPYGYASLAQGESALLAWNESLTLNSYLELYHSTGDYSWLEQLIAHTDYSLSFLTDYDQDGYLGWHAGRYAVRTWPENNSFNEPLLTADAGEVQLLPTSGWVKNGTTENSHFKFNTPEADLEMKSVQTNIPKLYYYMTNYTPDTEHILSFDVKTSGPGTQAYFYLYNWGTPDTGIMKALDGEAISLIQNNTEWEHFEFKFKTPVLNPNPNVLNRIGIIVMFNNDATPGNTAYYSNFQLTTLDTEPKKWTLLPTADSTHTRIESDSYNGNGLVVASTEDASSAQGVHAFVTDYLPDKLHEITFHARTDGGSANGRIIIKDETTNEPLAFVNKAGATRLDIAGNEWAVYEGKFLTPKSGNKLAIYIENADPASPGTLHVDEVIMRQTPEYLVHEANMYTPIAKFIKTVYDDAELASRYYDSSTTYKEKADEYLPYVKDFVAKWEKDYREVSASEAVYVWTNDDASAFPGNTHPHNQYIKIVNVLLPLAEVTGDQSYRDKAEKLLTFFKSKLRLRTGDAGNYYIWNYYDPALPKEPVTQSIRIEDISHANLDIEAALAGYKYGVVFTDEDMQRFANTFDAVVWNGSLESPVIYRYIEDNPDSNHYYEKHPYLPVYLRDWVDLSPWNDNIYQVVHATTVSVEPTEHKLITYALLHKYWYNNQPIEEISISLIVDKLEGYMAAEAVGKPLTNQLSNSLSQAEHHWKNSQTKQAIKSLEDFLKHINNNPHQDKIDAYVKEDLATAVQTLIAEWKNN